MAKLTNTNVTASTNAPEATMEIVAAVYIGDGAYIPGIPARSLTTEEWDTLPVFIQQSLISQGIYRLAEGASLPSMETPTALTAPVTTS